MKIKLMATALVALMIFSGIGILVGGSEGGYVLNGPPTRADYRYFIGYVGNLTPENHDDVNLSNVLQVTGTDTGTQPPTTLGPFNATFNETTMEFVAEVDITNHDQTVPWRIELHDRYGWNETGGGTINILTPTNWTKPIPSPEYLPNGTLDYFPGKFGNLSLTIYNGTSGEPLEGVRFHFFKHWPFNSDESGLETDANGDVFFKDMQMGLEGTDNSIQIFFDMPHFNTNDGSGFVRRVLKEGQTAHYDITLKEDPLVRSFFPADGSTGIKTDRNQVGLFVQFHSAMNLSSVNSNTLFLEKVGGAKVDLDYSWSSGNQFVTLTPQANLEYNSTYRLTVLPRVQESTEDEPLWRTFTTTFTTWKKPPLISGTVLINGTTDPAPEGTTIQVDGLEFELVDGYFTMEVREDYEHTITVWGPTVGDVDEYLYYGDRSDPYKFTIPRGYELTIDELVVHEHPTRSVIISVVNEDEQPMRDVNLLQFITGETKVTDETGQVQFDNIRLDLATPFKATFPNFYDMSFPVHPGTASPTIKNITLLEKPLPVEILAIGEVYIPLEDEVIIGVDNYIRLDFPNNMETETMSTDNIKIIGPGGSEVQIDVFNETSTYKKWRVVPRADLAYNAKYTLLVSESISEVGGNNPFWRDLRIVFNTEKLPSAAINGRVTINDKGVEGVRIEVYYEGTMLRSGYSEANGAYLLDVNMNQLQLFPVTIVANGSELGLSTNSVEQRTLKAGYAINNTDFSLERLEDWFAVIYPKDEMGRMVVDGSITIRFGQELDRTDMVSFMENFTLGSPSKELDIQVSEDGKTVTLKPTEALDYDQSYVLSISNFADGEFYRELLTMEGKKALIRGEVMEILTELKPIEVILTTPDQSDIANDTVPLDIQIYLYFTNYVVDRDIVESNFQLVNADTDTPVGNLSFTWATTGRSVGIDHDDFEPISEYMILLPEGEYGTNGARIRSPFLVYFTTIAVEDRTFFPIDNFPTTEQSPGLITVTAENTKGRPIRISVAIRSTVNPSAEYEEILNFTLGPLETKQVTLDFTGKERGEYQVLITAFDGIKGARLNSYTRNIFIGEPGEDGGGPPWLIIIIVIAVIAIVVILGIFLYMQSKKTDIEEELKEEFECPECHNLVGSDDTVCPHCGAEFEEEAYKCPKCGNMLDPEDDECSECGYDFSDQDKMELEDEEEDEDISEMYEEGEMELDEEENEEEFEEMDEDEEEEEED
ncbi:MAG: Ig-like domain-containing protein [Thermoplasmatota archaeon]